MNPERIRTIEATRELIRQIREGGDCSNLRELIERGADIHGRNNYTTPIAECIVHRNINCLRALIDAGADVDVFTAFGPNLYSPLIMAVNGIGNPNEIIDEEGFAIVMINILLDAGANINYKSRNGITALIQSIFTGHNQIAHLLIDRGANINLQNIDGSTPLMFALNRNRFDIATRLVGMVDNVNVQNNGGFTALYYACKKNTVELVEKLIDRGADVNLLPNPSSLGQLSPLYTACSEGNIDVIKILLANGAETHHKYGNPLITALEKLEENHPELYDEVEKFMILVARENIFHNHYEYLEPEITENILRFNKGRERGGKSRRNQKRNKKTHRRKSSRRRRKN